MTTGASMWVAIDVACGLGEWVIAGMTVILTLIIALVGKLEQRAGTYGGDGD